MGASSTRTLLVGRIATEDMAVDTISVERFVRTQLDGRFGHIALGREISALNAAAQRLIIHNCAAHLVPGGTLGLAVSAAALTEYLDASGFAPLAGASGTGSVWRRDQRRTVHDIVADARRRFARVSAMELFEEISDGPAVIVDIRVPEDRRRHGVIKPSLSVPRTVLEWRLDPASGYSNPLLDSSEQRVVVVCNEGYSSSLAVAALLDLGFANATDLVGGVVAWIDAGLPVSPSDRDEETYLGPPER